MERWNAGVGTVPSTIPIFHDSIIPVFSFSLPLRDSLVFGCDCHASGGTAKHHPEEFSLEE
jgi:hypothetical protein